MSGKYLHQRASWVWWVVGRGRGVGVGAYFYNKFYETHSILHFKRIQDRYTRPRALTIHLIIISNPCCILVILMEVIITKTRLFKYIESFTTKKGKFSDKKF